MAVDTPSVEDTAGGFPPALLGSEGCVRGLGNRKMHDS
jgi:hypothetical protein